MNWLWPLPNCEMILHANPHPGGFGTPRRFDVHTGIDVYCEPEQLVVASEDGVVVLIENFTGENAIPSSPWWHETKAILIEGASGVIAYGEIRPLETITVGQKISQGETIGNVISVLKKDKGTPMTMLHLELYKHGTRRTVVWKLGEPQPDELLNPITNLVFLK